MSSKVNDYIQSELINREVLNRYYNIWKENYNNSVNNGNSNLLETIARFKELKDNECYCLDKSSVRVLEIINAQIKTENITDITKYTPFTKIGSKSTNIDYSLKEINWYLDMNLSIDGLQPTPTIWTLVADKNRIINSNYGYIIFSDNNKNQFLNAICAILENIYTRRSIMIYQCPEMHYKYKENNRNDFVCTISHQFIVRKNKNEYTLNSIINMRSQDFIYGYLNDIVWFNYVHFLGYEILTKIIPEITINRHNIYLNVGSLHIYEKHFKLLDNK